MLLNLIREIQPGEPKSRILESAAKLFSEKGYAAVGVREIAQSAGVNLSMISYYYGGKIGALKAIIEEYFTHLKQIVTEIKDAHLESSERILSAHVTAMVKLFRNKSELCKVAIMEIPIDLPEVEEYKIRMMKEHLAMIENTFHSRVKPKRSPELRAIIGPAFISLVASHFLMGPALSKIHNVEFNDEFYELYSQAITALLLGGLSNLSSLQSSNENKE